MLTLETQRTPRGHVVCRLAGALAEEENVAITPISACGGRPGDHRVRFFGTEGEPRLPEAANRLA